MPVTWTKNSQSNAYKCDPKTRNCYFCYGNSCVYGKNPNLGIVYMRSRSGGEFGYLCTDKESNAEVLCKELGFPVYDTNGATSSAIRISAGE